MRAVFSEKLILIAIPVQARVENTVEILICRGKQAKNKKQNTSTAPPDQQLVSVSSVSVSSVSSSVLRISGSSVSYQRRTGASVSSNYVEYGTRISVLHIVSAVCLLLRIISAVCLLLRIVSASPVSARSVIAGSSQ